MPDLLDQISEYADWLDDVVEPVTAEESLERAATVIELEPVPAEGAGPPRRWTWLAAAAIAAVLLAVGAALFLRDDDSTETDFISTVEEDAVGEPLEPGWHEFEAPVQFEGGTVYPSWHWTGEDVLYWLSKPTSEEHPGDLAVGILDASTGEWRESSPAPLAPRMGPVSVWTGTELIVWGGVAADPDDPFAKLEFADGAAYDPETDRWRQLADDAPLSSVHGYRAAWTGSEVVLWGGYPANGWHEGFATSDPILLNDQPLNEGASYDPASDSWTPIADSPLEMTSPKVGWTGERVLVWETQTTEASGGEPPKPSVVSATYDVDSKTWSVLPAIELQSRNAWTALTDNGLLVGDTEGRVVLLDPHSGQSLEARVASLERDFASPGECQQATRVYSLDSEAVLVHCGTETRLDLDTLEQIGPVEDSAFVAWMPLEWQTIGDSIAGHGMRFIPADNPGGQAQFEVDDQRGTWRILIPE